MSCVPWETVPGFVSSASCPGAPKRRQRTRGAAIRPGAAETPCTAPTPCLHSSSACGKGSQPGAADRSACRYDLHRNAAECSQAGPYLRLMTATRAPTLPDRTPFSAARSTGRRVRTGSPALPHLTRLPRARRSPALPHFRTSCHATCRASPVPFCAVLLCFRPRCFASDAWCEWTQHPALRMTRTTRTL